MIAVQNIQLIPRRQRHDPSVVWMSNLQVDTNKYIMREHLKDDQRTMHRHYPGKPFQTSPIFSFIQSFYPI
jgi:hypothetical protein